MAVLHYAQAPRAIMITLVMTAIFLLSFVMVGCMHPSSAFATVYLVDYKYNTDSPFYGYIQDYFNSSSSNSNATLDAAIADASTLTVRTGLMGICTTLEGDIKCTSQNVGALNRSELHTVANFTIFEGSSDTELGSINLLDLAINFSSKDKYGLLMATLICLGASICSLVFVALFPVPPMNWRNWSGYFFLLLGLVFVLVSCLTIHTASHTAQSMVRSSSLGLVTVDIANKTTAMYWTAFAFILLASLLIIIAHRRLEDEYIIEQEKKKLRV